MTVKVISGDNPVTVGAVAKRAGLEAWDRNVDAKTLPGDDDLAALARRARGEHRVRPGHPAPEAGDGARAAAASGHTVAMTGDGVNDVLALKDADCGVAMASGSEATRGVAQLVLMDSNFSALPSVVAEGRRVINNIERVASLFLTKTVVLDGPVGRRPACIAFNYPLRPIHLTLLSWFTIGVPAFFLALEPNATGCTPDSCSECSAGPCRPGIVIAVLTMTVFEIVQLDDVDRRRPRPHRSP